MLTAVVDEHTAQRLVEPIVGVLQDGEYAVIKEMDFKDGDSFWAPRATADRKRRQVLRAIANNPARPTNIAETRASITRPSPLTGERTSNSPPQPGISPTTRSAGGRRAGSPSPRAGWPEAQKAKSTVGGDDL